MKNERGAEDFTLAKRYHEDGNYAAAIDYYKKAADAGHREAQYELGKMYCEGIVVTKNTGEGIRLLKEAARPRDNGGILAAAAELLEDIAAADAKLEAPGKSSGFMKFVTDAWAKKTAEAKAREQEAEPPEAAQREAEARQKAAKREAEPPEAAVQKALKEIAQIEKSGSMSWNRKTKKFIDAAKCLLEAAEAGNVNAMWELSLILDPYSSSLGSYFWRELESLLGDKRETAHRKWLEKAAGNGEPNAVAVIKKEQASRAREEKRLEREKAWKEAHPGWDAWCAEEQRRADGNLARVKAEEQRKEREARIARELKARENEARSAAFNAESARMNQASLEATRRAEKERKDR